MVNSLRSHLSRDGFDSDAAGAPGSSRSFPEPEPLTVPGVDSVLVWFPVPSSRPRSPGSVEVPPSPEKFSVGLGAEPVTPVSDAPEVSGSGELSG